jgi:asparagine synthase (glutamine-hydrolysing)
MCGIAGLISISAAARPLDAEAHKRVLRMTERLAHRGPDDAGLYTSPDNRVILGHRRLAIIDPTPEAHQPMISARGNVLAFNGEIYNFRELAKKYAVGPSASDTAILLALLEHRGTAILPELVGFFSFAYWNADAGTLTIARDRFGKKPIYYDTSDTEVTFASELGAVIAAKRGRGEISNDTLSVYLQYYSLPHPLTPIRNVRCLPPGSVMTIDQRAATCTMRSWRVASLETSTSRPFAGTYDEAVRGIRERLERSIEYRMVSDVPVGAFLSGGLDSNAIVGLMSQRTPHLKTFTIGFAGFTDNETELAHIGAKHFKTEHFEHTYTDKEVAALLPQFFASMDSPTGDGLNSFLIATFARQSDPNLKVILTGTGGDELFLGYKKYRWMAQHRRISSLCRALPERAKVAIEARLRMAQSPARSLLQALLRPEATRVLFTRSEIMALLGSETHSDPQIDGTLSSLLAWDIDHYLPDVLLRDMDVFTMAHSFEARVPLLDAELADFVTGLPISFRAHGPTKQLLIDATKDILPQQLLDKPKTGFELPLSAWLKRGALRPYLDQLGAGEMALIRDGLLNGAAVRHVEAEFRGGRAHYLKAWSIIALEQWYRHFIQEVAG